MQELHINLWAVVGAGVARFIVGALWYSPVLFAKQWMSLSGIKESQMTGMAKASTIDFIGGLVMAWVLAHAIRYAGAHGVGQGMMVGFFIWLGFIATLLLGSVLYEKKPFNLFLIHSSYTLLSCLIMGAILVTWV